MGHISKRGDKWRARIPNPNRRGKSAAKIERKFATKREAERWLTEQQSRINRGEWIDPNAGRRTVAAVAAEWEATWLLDGLAPRTRGGYASILRRHVIPEFGEARVTAITPDAIQGWLGELAANREPNTIRRIYSVMRAVMGVAVERRYIAVNPSDGVRMRKLKSHSPSERVVVTEAEARALADAIDPHYRVYMLTAAYTGMRAGEIRALRRRDYNSLTRQLHVERAVKEIGPKQVAEERAAGHEVHGNLIFGPTKTFERRRITLPGWLAVDLEAHLEGRPADPDALMFATESGDPIRQSNFYRRQFKPAVRATLPEAKHAFRWHDFRHSHASWLIAGGANVLQVQARLGHRDATTTLNTYAHAFPSDEEALAGMFTAEPQPDNVIELHDRKEQHG